MKHVNALRHSRSELLRWPRSTDVYPAPFGPESLSRQSLDRLCTCLAASFDRPDAGVWITVSGEIVEPDRRRPLLLLISELMTNALKHGNSNEEVARRHRAHCNRQSASSDRPQQHCGAKRNAPTDWQQNSRKQPVERSRSQQKTVSSRSPSFCQTWVASIHELMARLFTALPMLRS